jgi:DNA-binding Lrp family transcriptional regulator
MIAKSLDIVVLLKLLLDHRKRPYAQLSQELGISASEIHAAVRRGVEAGLIDPETRIPLRKPFEEYLLHGVRYAFPAKLGSAIRGIPTAYAAPPLSEKISSNDLPPVWPDSNGTVRGFAVEPLYHRMATVVKSDSRLYELLALVDALRIGRARERSMAEEELKLRLTHAYAI